MSHLISALPLLLLIGAILSFLYSAASLSDIYADSHMPVAVSLLLSFGSLSFLVALVAEMFGPVATEAFLVIMALIFFKSSSQSSR